MMDLSNHLSETEKNNIIKQEKLQVQPMNSFLCLLYFKLTNLMILIYLCDCMLIKIFYIPNTSVPDQ